jgi:DNA-binding GntR family transcriptional regulator
MKNPVQTIYAPDAVDATPSQIRFLELFNTIRRRIVLHDLPPGMQLDLDQLAEEFAISRTPLRSVMQRLVDDELVINRHGVPTTVSAIDLACLPDAMAFRMRLAEMIGDLSPVMPGKANIEAMEGVLRRFDELGDEPDIRAFGSIDLDLHDCVCAVIGNPHLRQTYDRMFYITARMWVHFLPRLEWSREVEVFRQETANWLGAMQRQDVAGLGFLVRNSLSNVLFRVKPLL